MKTDQFGLKRYQKKGYLMDHTSVQVDFQKHFIKIIRKCIITSASRWLCMSLTHFQIGKVLSKEKKNAEGPLFVKRRFPLLWK